MLTKHKPCSLALLLSLFYVSLQAQSQSSQVDKIQNGIKIKIDGKAADWNPLLKRTNTNTDINYSITNDEVNLYLMIQSKDEIISKEILGGGVSLTLNNDGKLGGMNFVSINYPIVSSLNQNTLGQLMNEEEQGSSQNASKKFTDSLLNVMNVMLTGNTKEIQVVGIKGIDDILISVYNSYGIKAAIQFKDKQTLVYEIALPLKYVLPLTLNNYDLFVNIKLGGIPNKNNTFVRQSSEGPVRVTNIPMGLLKSSHGDTDTRILNYSTDFWMKYMLQKH